MSYQKIVCMVHSLLRLADTLTEAAGATYVKDLKDLLTQSDVVSVHVPLSDATRHFISTEEFKHFKKGARLVNTARGPVVDEEAMVEALKSGQLSGAALDVFEQEPKVHPYLLEADNVLLQPHVGVSWGHSCISSKLTPHRRATRLAPSQRLFERCLGTWRVS